MRKIHIVALALVAVLAFSALAAASASAHEWLFKTEKIAAALVSDTSGELLLEEMKEKTQILCNGLFEGTVGPGAVDLITLVEGLEGKNVEHANELNKETGWISCEFIAHSPCEEANGALATVYPVNLPWETELVAITVEGKEEIVDKIFNATKNPGYEIECKVAGLKGTVTCVGNTATLMTNAATGVEGEFDPNSAVSPAAECTSILGKGEGLITGTGTVTAAGGVLSIE